MSQNIHQPLEQVVYFLIDKTTRAMRRYTHQELKKAGLDLTIDQFVVLKMLEERDSLTQSEMAEELFKDNASITRIIELLVNKGFVNRNIGANDRRTFNLNLTEEGKEELERCKPIVYEIRAKGMEGLSDEEVEITKNTLKKIADQFL